MILRKGLTQMEIKKKQEMIPFRLKILIGMIILTRNFNKTKFRYY